MDSANELRGFTQLSNIVNVASKSDNRLLPRTFGYSPLSRWNPLSGRKMRRLSGALSISFPQAIYQSLEALAKQKKVSLAWVVREATERYVAEEISDTGKEKQQPRTRPDRGNWRAKVFARFEGILRLSLLGPAR